MGRDPFLKPLAPKIFILQFITAAKLQLGSSNKDNVMAGGQHNKRNCIKGLRHYRKGENHGPQLMVSFGKFRKSVALLKETRD